MSPIGALLLIIICINILALPRQYAALPFLVCTLYLTMGQVIIVAGLHLYPMTIVAIFAIIRLFLRQEFFLHDTDKITLSIVIWATVGIATSLLLLGLNGEIMRIRTIFECLLLYIFFKSIFRSFSDISFVCKMLPFLIFPLACSMFLEFYTGHNIFSYLGITKGIPIIKNISDIRNGHYRSQGSFWHPILAGTFGATSMPLIVAMWFQKSYRKIWCVLGIISSIIITITAISGGPRITFILEIIAFTFWFYRNNMQFIRNLISAILVISITIITFVLNDAPWNIFNLLSKYTVGNGQYRSQLYTSAFGKYFHEWWLMGSKDTAHLSSSYITGTRADITSAYLGQGLQGGILTMILFILIIYLCFRGLGRALHRNKTEPLKHLVLLWALGVTLFGHAASFISVSYFDQTLIWYYMLLGMLGAVSAIPLHSSQTIKQ